MSITKRLQQGFLRLPLAKKAVLVSSALLAFSPVLPWYDNRNSFGVGESFIGLKGPLFLVGILCLAFGAISFFNLFFPLMGRNFFRLKRKAGAMSSVFGLQSLILLVIANSVFFHPSFGVNVAHKGTRFGMMLAFVTAGIMFVAGWVAHRQEKNAPEEETDEAMVNPSPTPTFQATPEPAAAFQTHRPVHTPPIHAPSVHAANEAQSVPSAFVGDPLTLDIKTRYKLMRSQERQSAGARENLWGTPSTPTHDDY